jgi:hypothetical protein
MIQEIKPAVVYIYVPGCGQHKRQAMDYVGSVLANPAMAEHRNIIVCQGGLPESEMIELFGLLDDQSYYVHDDSGWDIGAYVAVAGQLDEDGEALNPMFCCGGSTTVRQPGWLKRMMEAWTKLGPGVYGTNASYQFRPHLNTSGFMCLPNHLLRYPSLVQTKAERYQFEHGPTSWWEIMHNQGERVRLVTWDGEYEWPQWRTPLNISCRGDQTNCLTYFRINYAYENGDLQSKLNLEFLTDRLTDQSFADQLCQCHPK